MLLSIVVVLLVLCSIAECQLPQRAFPPYEHEFPCFPSEKSTFNDAGDDLKGLVLIMVPKTGSSTLSGINLRMAHHHTNIENDICSSVHFHRRAQTLQVTKRNKKNTFLWTFLREPVSHTTSFFFWHWRLKKGEPTLDNFKNYVEFLFRDFDHFPQIGFVSPKPLGMEDMSKADPKIIQEILDEYDFIGINERYDESLVALRLILNLNPGDILYLSSKVSGGYDSGARGGCHKIPEKIEWPGFKEFVSSPYWKRRYRLPKSLYYAANRSLDLTIDRLGRDRFNKALAEHKQLMALINEKCADNTIFPCSDGVLQMEKASLNCYKSDFGCGYPCIDEVMKEVEKQS